MTLYKGQKMEMTLYKVCPVEVDWLFWVMITRVSKHHTAILKKKMLSVWFKWTHKWAS